MSIEFDKHKALAMPVFPKYREKVSKGEGLVSFESTVYAHLERFSRIDVYVIPVITTYLSKKITAKDKQHFLDEHLKRCLVISKYFKNTEENLAIYPIIDSISKEQPEIDFLTELHTKYP